jgi:hypothetical protein
VYIDPVQRRAWWKLVAVGGTKKAQQWTEGSKTGAEKIGRNCKNHRNRHKSNTAKHLNKIGMEEAKEEEKGREAPGLGTSSKLLESGAKWTWEGGMAEAIPPPLQLRRSGRGVMAG